MACLKSHDASGVSWTPLTESFNVGRREAKSRAAEPHLSQCFTFTVLRTALQLGFICEH